MKRRSFIKLAAMAAAALGLPKVMPEATEPDPSVAKLIDYYPHGIYARSPIIYGDGSGELRISQRVQFYDAGGNPVVDGRVTIAHPSKEFNYRTLGYYEQDGVMHAVRK